MSFLTNLGMVFLMGVGGFFLLPLLAAALKIDWGLRVSKVYDGMAMSLLGTGGFVLRETGGVTLSRLSYDAQLQRFTASFGGVTKYFADTANCIGRFAGGQFALADEKRGVIFTPMHADIGEAFAECKRADEWAITDGGTKYMRKYFTLSPAVVAPSLSGVRAVVQGSSNPMRLDDHYRIWEAALSSPTASWIREHIDRISAVGTGFVIMWITREVGGTATVSGGGITEEIGGTFIWAVASVVVG